jgi:hypothetical protein
MIYPSNGYQLLSTESISSTILPLKSDAIFDIYVHLRPFSAAPIFDPSQNEQLAHRCYFNLRILMKDRQWKLPTASVDSSITNVIIIDVLKAHCPSFMQLLPSSLIAIRTSIINATIIKDFKRVAKFIITH